MVDDFAELQELRRQFEEGWTRLRDQGKISEWDFRRVMKARHKFDRLMLEVLRKRVR